MKQRGERELASDGIQMATNAMHNNDLKVHSGTYEYNFRRIHTADPYLEALWIKIVLSLTL